METYAQKSGGIDTSLEPVSFEDLVGRPPNDIEEKYAPERLYVRGPTPMPLDGPCVSIVGTRHPSEKGVAAARDLARSLAENGVAVVSGLAAGIDAVAHRASMERGRTVAVLGTPLDRVYPAQNRQLQDAIMEKHLAVSQFEPASAIRRGNFVMRNRTMALISHATVIVEAGAKSGTEHQGWEAVRLNRPLFIGDEVADEPWVEKLCQYGAVRSGSLDNILDSIPPPEIAPATIEA